MSSRCRPRWAEPPVPPCRAEKFAEPFDEPHLETELPEEEEPAARPAIGEVVRALGVPYEEA
jgi:hypothetical protein